MKTTTYPVSGAASALALGLLLALGGCGGGGSDAPTSAGTTSGATTGTSGASTTTGTGTSTTTSAGTSTPTGSPLCTAPDFSAAALARINQIRAAGADCRTFGVFAPTTALGWSPLLTQAATAHSQDMAAANFFAHVGTGGSTLATRVTATGYPWQNLGENIGAGYADVDTVISIWMASDGHCANLMNPIFNAVGVACAAGNANTSYSNYWTMDLARPL